MRDCFTDIIAIAKSRDALKDQQLPFYFTRLVDNLDVMARKLKGYLETSHKSFQYANPHPIFRIVDLVGRSLNTRPDEVSPAAMQIRHALRPSDASVMEAVKMKSPEEWVQANKSSSSKVRFSVASTFRRLLTLR